MVNNDPWTAMQYDLHKESPNTTQNPYSDPWDQMKADIKEPEEPSWKSTIRTIMQPIQGFLATTSPGIAAGFWQLLASGEVNDPEEIERIRRISEEQGIPFDEDKWNEAANNALKYIPTVSNIARETEELTGAPLEPKTHLQKALRFGTEATRLSPEGMTLRPLNVGLPKPALGAGVLGAKELLESMGTPEPFAEILAFGMLKQPTPGAASITAGKVTKPSGLTQQRYEKIEKPTEVAPKKIKKIEENVENEFRDIADKIIEKSPVEETHTALKESKAFKEEAKEAFGKVSELAESIPDKFGTLEVKKQIVQDFYQKGTKGITPSEYETAHRGFLRKFIKNTPKGEMSTKQLVEQFRKNNEDLASLYEPGKSFAYNQAKRNAYLDYNRAISNLIEKKFPDTEFANLFKSSNERWSKIMDAEAIDKFMDRMFEGKIDFKVADEFFNKNGLTKPFERGLGKEGFNDFKQLMTDLMTKEQAHKYLVKAENNGWEKLGKTAVAFMFHPIAGKAKFAYDTGKFLQRKLFEFVMDKPQYAVKWHKGIQDMKKGNFSKAEKAFEEIKEAAEAPKEAIKPTEILKEEKPKAEKKGETIEGKAEKIEKPKEETQEHVQKRIEELKEKQPPVESKTAQPEKRLLEHKPKEAIKPSEILKEEKPKTKKKDEILEGKAEKVEKHKEASKGTTFKTEKGSEYSVNENNTTTRNKKFRPEHGEKEQGIQPVSEKTYYGSKEDLDKLSLFQTQNGSKSIYEFPDGRLGVMYTSGPNKGKIEARTVVTPKKEPELGLYPIEMWNKGDKIHFGNKITEVNKSIRQKRPPVESKKAQSEKKLLEHKPEKKLSAELEGDNREGVVTVKNINNKEVAWLDYSIISEGEAKRIGENTAPGVHLEQVNSQQPGGAKEAFLKFYEKFKDKDIYITPATEKGSHVLKKELGIDISARIRKNESNSQTLARPRIDYKLTALDKKRLDAYLMKGKKPKIKESTKTPEKIELEHTPRKIEKPKNKKLRQEEEQKLEWKNKIELRIKEQIEIIEQAKNIIEIEKSTYGKINKSLIKREEMKIDNAQYALREYEKTLKKM